MRVEPDYTKSPFTCPHCGVLAEQHAIQVPSLIGTSFPLGYSQCRNCTKSTVWELNPIKRLVYPVAILGPEPNADMPPDIAIDFNEARRIGFNSPRGAAALLRLAIQKLCVVLGQPGKNINQDISELVKAGLPQLLQQSLDAVRVIGNNAVHPGELDLRDDSATVLSLFALINVIVERMISEPKQIQEIYASLPQAAKDAVERREPNATRGRRASYRDWRCRECARLKPGLRGAGVFGVLDEIKREAIVTYVVHVRDSLSRTTSQRLLPITSASTAARLRASEKR